MRVHVFSLSALGAYPEGPAHGDARDLVQALVEAGEPVVIQTELAPRSLGLARDWLASAGYPEQLDLQGREDDFPTGNATLAGAFASWFGDWVRGRGEVALYCGSMAELEAIAGQERPPGCSVDFHHVTPQAVYRVMT